jgi:hypothetical protein
MTPRNRIIRHVRVRAGDLVPHELNPRIHTQGQRQALADLYERIGFARSLLAFALPDGRLKLIDGHLRAGMDADHEVEVEVLDVTEEEARVLLLSLDPLVQLAEHDQRILDQLRSLTHTDSAVLSQLWSAIGKAGASTTATLEQARTRDAPPPPTQEQWLILVECESEEEQITLLERFQAEGLKCRALMS